MTESDIANLVALQRRFFLTGATLPVSKRLELLKNLRDCIKRNESAIAQALSEDLGKSSFESYMCETGLVLSELSYMIKHLPAFAKEKTVLTPLAQFHSRSFKKPSPHGVVLIMSPWNYPFMLTLEPLVDALAAGNTAILKPSALLPGHQRPHRKNHKRMLPSLPCKCCHRRPRGKHPPALPAF